MGNPTNLTKYAVLSFLIMVCFFASHTAFAEKSNINLITGPFGTSSYVMGTALEDIARKYSDNLTVGHSETPGIGFNLKKMHKSPEEKKTTVIANAPPVIYMARAKSGPFKKMKEGIAHDLRAIANYNASIRFYVSRDTSLKELIDLKGKSVGLGTKQQAWGFAALWDLEIGAGLTKSDYNPQLIGTDAAITAFKDKLVDAVVGGGYVNPVSGMFSPAPFFRQLTATGEKLYYINTGEAVWRKVSSTLGFPFSVYTLKPVKNTPGLDRPITLPLATVGWYAYLDFPEEEAYELTKMIIKNVDKFAEYHGLGKLMTKELLCYEFTPEETHPGAYRAYKEAGLVK